jgi:ERCC4-type nuclease
MKVILDVREKSLYDQCIKIKDDNKCFDNINIECMTLEVGDILIKDTDSDKIIIERKSVSDLIASIKDGRYTEQSYRLSGIEHHNHNIIYLIEGNLRNLSKEKQMAYSSIFSINYYKGFSVYRSDNVNESAYIILNMTLKLSKEKDKKPYYTVKQINTDTSEPKETKYCEVIKKEKKANITPENFGEILLCQIPSVSSVTSIAIMNKYKTILDLINSIKEDSKCLDNITYSTSKNQTRKISKNCIENIKKYLLYEC